MISQNKQYAHAPLPHFSSPLLLVVVILWNRTRYCEKGENLLDAFFNRARIYLAVHEIAVEFILLFLLRLVLVIHGFLRRRSFVSCG